MAIGDAPRQLNTRVSQISRPAGAHGFVQAVKTLIDFVKPQPDGKQDDEEISAEVRTRAVRLVLEA